MSLPAERVPQPATPQARRGAGALRRPEGAEGARPPLRSEAPPAPPAPRSRRRKKHHVGFAILATAVVGPMVLGIVSLNALLAQTSFRIDEAERRIETLTTERLDLVHEQATLSAPGRIAAWARRNGMRLPDDIRFLHASGDRQTAPAGADTSSPGAEP